MLNIKRIDGNNYITTEIPADNNLGKHDLSGKLKLIRNESIIFDINKINLVLSSNGPDAEGDDAEVNKRLLDSDSPGHIPAEGRIFSWLKGMTLSLAGLFSSASLYYYLRYGSQTPQNDGWISSLPPSQQKQANLLLSIINSTHTTDGRGYRAYPPKSFKEAFFSTIASIRLSDGLINLISDTTTYNRTMLSPAGFLPAPHFLPCCDDAFPGWYQASDNKTADKYAKAGFIETIVNSPIGALDNATVTDVIIQQLLADKILKSLSPARLSTDERYSGHTGRQKRRRLTKRAVSGLAGRGISRQDIRFILEKPLPFFNNATLAEYINSRLVPGICYEEAIAEILDPSDESFPAVQARVALIHNIGDMAIRIKRHEGPADPSWFDCNVFLGPSTDLIEIERNNHYFISVRAFMTEIYSNKTAATYPIAVAPEWGDDNLAKDAAPANELDKDTWLHTLGLSNETRQYDKYTASHFIDRLLNNLVLKDGGFALTSGQLDRNLTININYRNDEDTGGSNNIYIENGVYTVRQILLKEPVKPFINGSIKRFEKNHHYHISIEGASEDPFISNIQQISNLKTINLEEELQQELRYFSVDPEVDDAYAKIAKNRLCIAMFPLLEQEKVNPIQQLVSQWLDGSINEQLVSLHSSQGEIVVPGILAIARHTGGFLVSISTGEVYLWTPYDSSEFLRIFIIKHLSLQQAGWVAADELRSKADTGKCNPWLHIYLKTSKDIWADLKSMDINKMSEHISRHDQGTGRSRSGDLHAGAQNALLVMNTAAPIAFYAAGGSPAGCAALTLGIGVIGTALYIDSALSVTEADSRRRAWNNALLGLFFTGLGALDDVYSIFKTLNGYAGRSLLSGANTIKNTLVDGFSELHLAELAEHYIRSSATERAIMLVRGLLTKNNGNIANQAFSSRSAMSRLLRFAHLISFEYAAMNAEADITEGFKKIMRVNSREQLDSIEAGLMLSVRDLGTDRIIAMLMNIGKDEFAGFKLGNVVNNPSAASGWQSISASVLTFSNDNVILQNGEAAALWIEENTLLRWTGIGQGLIKNEEALSVKFRRYCQRFLSKGDVQNILFSLHEFADKNGFHDIKYRMLTILYSEKEYSELHDYVLIAKRQGLTYLFDISHDGKVPITMDGLTKASIMLEDEWLSRFKTRFPSSAVKYREFVTTLSAEQHSGFREVAGSDEGWLIRPRNMADFIDDGASKPIIYQLSFSKYDSSERQTMLLKKLRKSIIEESLENSNFGFIVDILRKINTLSVERKTTLELINSQNPQLAMRELLGDTTPVTHFNDLLSVGPGILLGLIDQNGVIEDTFISVGNGRFAGITDSISQTRIQGDMRIYVAEQLGNFIDNRLSRYNRPGTYTVVKSCPWLSRDSASESLLDIADKFCRGPITRRSNYQFAMDILVEAGRIAPQQASALVRLVDLMIGQLDGAIISHNKLGKLLLNDLPVDSTDLASMVAGKLVVFSGPEKFFYMMISLGNDKFVGLDNTLINTALKKEQMIVSAKEIGQINYGWLENGGSRFRVISGEPNLEMNRIQALLGPDGRIGSIDLDDRHVRIEVKAHGSLASVNHYDARELAEIILGYHLSTNTAEKKIKVVDLISCYGALGGQRSSAQIIADRLGVTVSSYRGVIVDNTAIRRISGIPVRPNITWGEARVRENERWHLRIHGFIESLCKIWQRMRAQRHSKDVINNMQFSFIIGDILAVLQMKFAIPEFLSRYPNLVSSEVLNLAITIIGQSDEEEMFITALMTILDGSRILQNNFDIYLLDNENEGKYPIVYPLIGLDLNDIFAGSQLTLATVDKSYELGRIVPNRNLVPDSNIYLSYKSAIQEIILENIIHVSQDFVARDVWPHILSSYLNSHSGIPPVVAGMTISSDLHAKWDGTKNRYYILSSFMQDFSLQISLPDVVPITSNNMLMDYVVQQHNVSQTRNTHARSSLDFSDFVLEGGKLLLAATDNSDSGFTPRPVPSDDSYLQKMIIDIRENEQRIILLQRNVSSYLHPEDLALYIAGEINAHTSCIKVGIKQDENIIPARSLSDNKIYIDPAYNDTSTVTIYLLRALG